MKRALGLACVMALVGVGAAAAVASKPDSTTTVFRDAVGEHAAGPDITAVTVSSDSGTLAFRIAIPTNPSVTPDFRLRVWLDADDSLDSGLDVEGPSGFDHFMLVDPTRFRPDEAVLYACTGGTNVCAPVPASLDFTYASGATLAVDARSMGLLRIERLRFVVVATSGIRYDPTTGYDLADARLDLAPDEGGWTFDARPLSVVNFRPTPPVPRAGRPLTLAMRVVRADTGATLVSGKVTCSLRVGGERVTARMNRFLGQRAKCSFDVPAGTKGSRFRATIAVAALGSGVTRSFSGRVR